jgi:hypothetical protein
MPAIPSRPYRVDLLLCGHHFRLSQWTLAAAGGVAQILPGRRTADVFEMTLLLAGPTALARVAATFQADDHDNVARRPVMRAEVGDELTVKGRHQGDEERHGEIIKIDGADGAPPYVVRWRDGRETVFFPASGTEVTHHPADRAG